MYSSIRIAPRLVGQLALLLSLAMASPAFATTGFKPLNSLAPPEGFVEPAGVGVNNTSGSAHEDVYVSDTSGVLARFSPTGVWERNASVVLPHQLSVDQNPGPMEGDVYVAGFAAGVVYRFSPDLVLEEEITGLIRPQGVAVDSAGDVFVAEITGNVSEFNAAGQPIDASGNPDPSNAVIEGLEGVQTVAVDGANDLFVATAIGTFEYTLQGGVYRQAEFPLDPSSASSVALTASEMILTELPSEFLEYEKDGTLVGRSAAGSLSLGWGIAVNTRTSQVYVADAGAQKVQVFEEGLTPEAPITEGAQATGATSVMLHGTLGAGATGYRFAYNNLGKSCEGGVLTPTIAASAGPVEVEVMGLEPLTTYNYCLVATNTFGGTSGSVLTFESGSIPPIIGLERFREVGASNAILEGQLSPEHSPGAYRFEYSTEPLLEAVKIKATPEVPYSAQSSVSATMRLSGLQPGTEYHARLKGINAHKETGSGAEIVFRTLPAAITGLPDGRVFEMVSPPEGHGADIYYPNAVQQPSLFEGIHTELLFQVAKDGEAVAYPSDPTSGGTGRGGKGLGNEYLARRHPNGGWGQSNIQPAGRLVTYYRGFTPSDLSIGVLSSGNAGEPDQPPLATEAPGEGYPVLYACENSLQPCSTPEETQGQPYQALSLKPLNRKAGEFGTIEAGHEVHVALVGQGVGPLFAGGSNDFSSLLFEANDALPGVEGSLGNELDRDALEEIAKHENNDYLYDNHNGHLSVVNVLPDGHVASNATFGGPSEELYGQPDFTRVISSDGRRVFWTALNTGVLYARSENSVTMQVSAGESQARYWSASADGRYVFYTEGEGEQSTLYRFDLEAPLGAQRSALSGAAGGVLGVISASEDGQSVYFVANGALSGANGEGQSPQKGQPNLYLSHDGEAPIFIATVSEEDGHRIEPFSLAINGQKHRDGDWVAGAGNRTAEGTDGGGSVVFMSNQKLTSVGYPEGYPNAGLEEVYLYEADINRLFCVSCSSTGEPVPGGANGTAAAFLPISWVPTYTPQWLADDGNRVFFDSAVPLVASDTDGLIDPYEWEREGTGSCTSETAVNGGCVYLLSSGSSESASWLIGASRIGNDAFVVSRARLSSLDQNEVFDMYDARVGGVVPVPPPTCSGSGCQGVPAAAPGFATPPSTTFNGVGNFPEPRSAGPTKRKPPKKKSKRSGKRSVRERSLQRALRVCARERGSRRATCVVRERQRFAADSKVVGMPRGGR